MVLSPTERQDLAIKLKAELQEFKQRETVYTLKRQQLRELELQYRKELDRQRGKSGTFKDKYKIHLEIIDELERQIGQN